MSKSSSDWTPGNYPLGVSGVSLTSCNIGSGNDMDGNINIYTHSLGA